MDEEELTYNVEIYLKSGAVIVVEVLDLVITSDEAGLLTGLEWSWPEDTEDTSYRRVEYLRLEDVSAIIMD